MTITQGDSYPIYIQLLSDGLVIKPYMVKEVEICVGSAWRKLFSSGEVQFDTSTQQWYIYPTQQETLDLQENQSYEITARIKTESNGVVEVCAVRCGRITVNDGESNEVI